MSFFEPRADPTGGWEVVYRPTGDAMAWSPNRAEAQKVADYFETDPDYAHLREAAPVEPPDRRRRVRPRDATEAAVDAAHPEPRIGLHPDVRAGRVAQCPREWTTDRPGVREPLQHRCGLPVEHPDECRCERGCGPRRPERHSWRDAEGNPDWDAHAAEAAENAAAEPAGVDVPEPFIVDTTLLLGMLITDLGEQGGRIGIAHDPERDPDIRWMVAYEFGREAEDSPMAGGASYSAASNLAEALHRVAYECRLLDPVLDPAPDPGSQ